MNVKEKEVERDVWKRYKGKHEGKGICKRRIGTHIATIDKSESNGKVIRSYESR